MSDCPTTTFRNRWTGIEPQLPMDMSVDEIRAARERQQQEWVRRNQPEGEELPEDLKNLPTPYWKDSDKQLTAAVDVLRLQLKQGKDAALKFAAERRKEFDAQAKAEAEKKDASNADDAAADSNGNAPHKDRSRFDSVPEQIVPTK